MAEVVKAYILVTVKRGSEHNVAERIEVIKEVTEVLITYGLYDLVVRIEAMSLGHLDKIVTDIRQIAEIEYTTTLIGT